MKNINSKNGGVLLMAMLVLLAFSILAIGLFKLEQTDAVEAVYVEQTDQAFWIAEAGLQRVLNKLRISAAYRKAITDSYTASSRFTETDTTGLGSYTADVWGDGSGTNFWIESQGNVRAISRRIRLSSTITQFGPGGLNGLDGNSQIRRGGTINGDAYVKGEFSVRAGTTISGEVLTENYEDFPEGGSPIPEDGVLDLSIDRSYFEPYLNMSVNDSINVESLDLAGGNIVVNRTPNQTDTPTNIFSTVTGGVLVIKGSQTFGKEMSVGNDITLIVDGDLTILKTATFGNNVTVYATGEMDLFKDATATSSVGTGSTFMSLDNMKINKDLNFDGLIFTEGHAEISGDLTLTGSLIADTFDIRMGATVTADEDRIPDSVANNMIVSTYIVRSGIWTEIAAQ